MAVDRTIRPSEGSERVSISWAHPLWMWGFVDVCVNTDGGLVLFAVYEERFAEHEAQRPSVAIIPSG